MLKKKMLQAVWVGAFVSFASLAAPSGTVAATSMVDVLPAGGFALSIEEGVCIDDIYVEPENEMQAEVPASGVVSEEHKSDELTVDEDISAPSISDDVSANELFNDESDVIVLDDAFTLDNTSEDSATESTTIMLDESASSEEAIDAVTNAVCVATEKSEILNDEQVQAIEEQENKDPEHFSNLVIASVDNYVNVRDIASTDGEVVGKLYDDSVGEFIEEQDGWYKIKSGNVTGFVKAEYCVTGEAAIDLAKKVGQRIATVTTTTLKVREEPSTESAVLGLVPIEENLSVLEEVDGWVKVSIEEGEGYVSTDYVNLWTDFVRAESKAEEEARLEKERQAQEAAKEAARKAQAERDAAAAKSTKTSKGSSSGKTYNVPSISSDGSMGSAVAQYACQFVGNPYVYGGSSLTNGTDCSGFVMSVYKAYGVSLPHSSTADRSQGYAVEGGLSNARPGDLICYSGHVALYIGNGQIVHASTSKTGIVISNANYRNVLAVRRIF